MIRPVLIVLVFLFALVSVGARAVPLTTQPNLPLLLSTCAAHAPIAGNVSGHPMVCDTLTAMLDSAFSSTQGTILYRNSTVWTALTPGTNGQFLQTLGPSANIAWATVGGGGSGCTVSGGAQFQILVNNGSSGCSSSPSATVNVGALALGASGTLGSVALGNATSGTITVEPVTGALGSVTLLLPAVSDTLTANAATQTLTNKSIAGSEINSGLVGASVGGTGVNNGSSTLTLGGSLTTSGAFATTFTMTAGTSVTFPTSGTLLTTTGSGASLTGITYTQLPTLSANQLLGALTATTPSGQSVPSCSASNDALTWTSGTGFGCNTISTSGTPGGSTSDIQYNSSGTFAGNGGLVYDGTSKVTLGVAGTSVGKLALNNATSGSLTIQPPTGALGSAVLTAPDVTDTLATIGTASQALSGGVHLTPHNYGTVTSGTTTLDCGFNPAQEMVNGGASTIAAPANDGQCIVLVTNNASAGAISFSGFTVGSNTGASLDTVNTHKFSIFVWETNGVAAYNVFAHQ
jgi:hypothetical protein